MRQSAVTVLSYFSKRKIFNAINIAMLRFRINVPQSFSYESPKKTGCISLHSLDLVSVMSISSYWKKKDDKDATASIKHKFLVNSMHTMFWFKNQSLLYFSPLQQMKGIPRVRLFFDKKPVKIAFAGHRRRLEMPWHLNMLLFPYLSSPF